MIDFVIGGGWETQVDSDSLEGFGDVFVRVAQGDGAAVGAGGGVFGSAEFG